MLTVGQLKKKLRGVSDKTIIVLSAHDSVTGKASFANMIDSDQIQSWNEDTMTNDFNHDMFVISS